MSAKEMLDKEIPDLVVDIQVRRVKRRQLLRKLRYCELLSKSTLTDSNKSDRMDEKIFRTSKKGKVYMKNTETGETSGLGPDIDGANAKTATSSIDLSVKPTVSDKKLQNIVNDLYKGQKNPRKIDDGTTMAAVRKELRDGDKTGGKFHSKKARYAISGLKERLSSGKLNKNEKAIARELMNDLKKALSGN